MGIDDCAIISDDVIAMPQTRTNPTLKNGQSGLSTNTPNSGVASTSGIQTQNLAAPKSEFLLDVIKSGLMLGNTTAPDKELTLAQLYLAFNKPTDLNLKYDFVITKSTTTTTTASSSMVGTSSESVSLNETIKPDSNTVSSHSIPLSHQQSQHQQYFFNAVASTAASFLNDIQKSKADAAAANAAAAAAAASSSQQGGSNIDKSNNSVFKLPSSKPTANNTNNSPSNIQQQQQKSSIAFLQPMTTPNQGAILTLDTVLAKINEDQMNKAKLMLSDLGSKRRSRQRKPVMVVNSGHSPRSLFPKINIINAINNNNNSDSSFIPTSTAANEQNHCQNIVFSG